MLPNNNVFVILQTVLKIYYAHLRKDEVYVEWRKVYWPE